MARVVDGGFAYRASEMITRAALLSTSQMLENSVPNPSVLVISLQQSEESRECIVKIQDSEVAACGSRSKIQDPRTVMCNVHDATHGQYVTMCTGAYYMH